MVGNFFLNKRIHLQYLRLAVAFGRYAYPAINSHSVLTVFKSRLKDKAYTLTRKKVNNLLSFAR